jgi:hypothetical protein
VEGYDYDALGNVNSRTQSWRNNLFYETFTYDGLNRLKSSHVDGKALQEYKYDAAGNIV